MATINYILVERSLAPSRSNHTPPPPWVLDREAELKLTGGYKCTPKNTCGVCFEYRAANGTCGC